MINRKALYLVVYFGLFLTQTQAQGPIKVVANSNYQLQTEKAAKARMGGVVSAQVTDTLALPFFDDFSGTSPYPDSRLWTDNYVYVNNHFSKNPKTRGVATFDHLNALGLPYGPMTQFFTSNADTLSSQAINLLDYQSGMSTIAYTTNDSIYLSFFMQSGGIGDAPDLQDSIVLYFLDNTDNWNSVWRMKDNAAPNFKQFFVGIKESKYLFKGFRFMFVNFVKNTGNMNHYHLDYVRFKAGRSFNDTAIKDVAFTIPPQQLLNRYSIMPYNHFLTNPTGIMASDRKTFFRNNNVNSVVVASVQAEAYNDANAQIDLVPFAQRNLNILADGDTFVKYTSFNISGLIGDTPTVRCVYKVLSPGNDETETNTYSSLSDNNSIERTQKFHHYYAYDDGSAEVGFGLDYASLPNGPAYVAMKYSLAKADTFRGMDIFFNRALEDVSTKSIGLVIWQEIANASGKTDKVLYKHFTTPMYTPGINGFARYKFDTLINLPAGDFYIGWQQNIKFILNVGWDENQENETAANPEVYYDLLGTWEKLPSFFTGALMMRPLIGQDIQDPVSIAKIKPEHKLQIFPNPSNGLFTIKALQKSIYSIYDMQGKFISSSNGPFENEHLVELKAKGLYICVVTYQDQTQQHTKLIIE